MLVFGTPTFPFCIYNETVFVTILDCEWKRFNYRWVAEEASGQQSISPEISIGTYIYYIGI